LLAAHLVRDHEDQPVALARRDQRETEPGVARGRLDQRRARADRAVALRGLDHRETDAVLDRAAGVLVFELDEELAGAGVEGGEPYERRVADQWQDAGGGARRLRCARGHERRTMRNALSRSRQRSSTCSSPIERRTSESPMPSARRWSTGIEACVMSAGCSARDSTPPRPPA